MLEKLIDGALGSRHLVLLVLVCTMAVGVWTLLHTPVDAFPDTTPVQVQINTSAPALNPEEIEQQITVPVESAVAGLPGLAAVRSISKFGMSQVVATFSDSVTVYNARQFIMERLGGVELPEGIARPELGPISSGLGEVFHYIVRSTDAARSLDELRTIHEWMIKPELRRVPGVAEVNTWGGLERQYHVVVSPEKLVQYQLTVTDVVNCLQSSNRNVGGGQVEVAGGTLLLHGVGRVASLEAIGGLVIRIHDGVPIRVSNVAEVKLGHEIRRGAVTAQGKGEAILGLAFMLLGENSKDVTERLRVKLDHARKSLPKDIEVEVVYDRTELVGHVIRTVQHNLLAGAALVIVVLFLILGNARAGLLVAITIPMAMLFALIGMKELSITASLLSLGAIDFGILVDGSVVMTEVNMRRMSEAFRRRGAPLSFAERLEIVRASSKEMARPIVFGMGIILVVFLPVLTLQGIEGKLFQPMAWTFIFALVGALLLAIFVSPVLSLYFLPRTPRERQGLVERMLARVYGLLLPWSLRRPGVLLTAVCLALAATGYIATRLGGEFLPRLSEGSIVLNIIRLPGISIDESVRANHRIELLLLREFPDEIDRVWSRIGTAEVATDPMGLELTDIFITLHPRERWRTASTQAELLSKIDAALKNFPGQNIVFTQPIELRVNEMISGLRGDIAVKVYGDDFEELQRISNQIQGILTKIAGAVDVAGDPLAGQPALRIAVRPDAAARYGIPASGVLDMIEAVGGLHAGNVIEGQRPFPLVVRLPDAQRTDVDALLDTIVPTGGGPLVSLRTLTEPVETETPSTINREWARRVLRVQCNVRGRDVSSFVNEARARIQSEVTAPEGYAIEWGGQFENLERARARLMLVVPITLALIFGLLYLSLKSLRDVLLIYTGIPFAVIGGVLALYARGIPFSVSAAVGFIALAGIAVLNGQLMIGAIRQAAAGTLPLHAAVVEAAKQRLRPVLATSITDVVGFIPMALSTGVGAEVQRPLATVVIGGCITSTLLTLFVLPALYAALAAWKGKGAEQSHA